MRLNPPCCLLLFHRLQILPSDELRDPLPAAMGPGDAPFAVLCMVNNHGGPSSDVVFQDVPLPNGTPYSIINGSTIVRGDAPPYRCYTHTLIFAPPLLTGHTHYLLPSVPPLLTCHLHCSCQRRTRVASGA